MLSTGGMAGRCVSVRDREVEPTLEEEDVAQDALVDRFAGLTRDRNDAPAADQATGGGDSIRRTTRERRLVAGWDGDARLAQDLVDVGAGVVVAEQRTVPVLGRA